MPETEIGRSFGPSECMSANDTMRNASGPSLDFNSGVLRRQHFRYCSHQQVAKSLRVPDWLRCDGDVYVIDTFSFNPDDNRATFGVGHFADCLCQETPIILRDSI